MSSNQDIYVYSAISATFGERMINNKNKYAISIVAEKE
jgi:hypothetical protein